MRWYVNRTGQGEGPFDEATILGMIRGGEVQAHHQICVEGGQTWEALSSHPAFAQASAPPAAPAAPAASPFGAAPAASPFGAAPAAPAAPPFQAAPAAPASPFQAAPAAAGFGDPSPAAPAAPAFEAPSPAAQIDAAANQVAAGVGGAANAFAGAMGAGPGAGLAAPMSGAPGGGIFEQAKASGQMPSDAAKSAAGKAHFLAVGGLIFGCWVCGLGGVIGSVIGNVLYKEQPKDPFAVFHINQALVFQGAIWAANIGLAIVFGAMVFGASMINNTLGAAMNLLYLVNLVLLAAAVILPILQAGKAKKGEWSQYPIIGAKVAKLKTPYLK